jgi:hypothetical protein
MNSTPTGATGMVRRASPHAVGYGRLRANGTFDAQKPAKSRSAR